MKTRDRRSSLISSETRGKSGPPCASETIHVPWLFIRQTDEQERGDV